MDLDLSTKKMSPPKILLSKSESGVLKAWIVADTVEVAIPVTYEYKNYKLWPYLLDLFASYYSWNL